MTPDTRLHVTNFDNMDDIAIFEDAARVTGMPLSVGRPYTDPEQPLTRGFGLWLEPPRRDLTVFWDAVDRFRREAAKETN